MRNPRDGKRKVKVKVFFWGTVICLLLSLTSARAEEEWCIRINIPEYQMYLYRGPELFRSYHIAVGKADSPSPTGNFIIVNKIVNPTWYPPDHKRPPIPAGPDNPLGKYWLGLNMEGYGIHGNSAPHSIGCPVSLGCFRMHNHDIEELFKIVPVGTPVGIRYRTMLSEVDTNSQAWLSIFVDIYHRENMEDELGNALNEIDWNYQPHLKALHYLLNMSKRPGRIQIPRVINIEGDIGGFDGFYWNETVYISRNILASLPVSSIPDVGNGLFNEYLDLKQIYNLGGLQISWNDFDNTLNINRGLSKRSP